MTLQEFEAVVTGFMDSFTTITLACAADDAPWAAAVYYARQGLDLVFFSSPGSRHSRIFSENPRAAGTIHGDYKGWKEIKGLQLEGAIEPITGVVDRAKALAVYLRRHPFAKEFLSDPAMLSSDAAKKMAKVAMYRFRPAAIHYMSNQAGFGIRWKLDVKDGKAIGEPERS
jgi:hypothetical protein